MNSVKGKALRSKKVRPPVVLASNCVSFIWVRTVLPYGEADDLLPLTIQKANPELFMTPRLCSLGGGGGN